MLGGLLLVLVLGLRGQGEIRARWHCEPAAIAVGEPFELVLELDHPAEAAPRALVPGALKLDDTWVVLAEEPQRSSAATPESNSASDTDGGARHTRFAWRVSSLEPGTRDLGPLLSSFALASSVSRIQVGDAHVNVTGLLAEKEDAPRPLAEFPEGFTDVQDALRTRSRLWIGAGLGGLGLAAVAFVLWRRRQRARPAPLVTPIERLVVLETQAASAGRESCYALTQLLREATDRARQKDRAGLTDEEWLAELGASPEIPPSALEDLGLVFARAARVKYAGEPASPWALQETFAKARVALQAVGAAGGRP